MKTCSKCKRWQPLSGFHKDAKSKDGHQPCCKDCHRVFAKHRQANTRFVPDPLQTEKACSRCKETKAVSEFKTHKLYRDGYYHMCRPCHRENTRAWRAKKPGYMKERYAKYKASGRSRDSALRSNYGITLAQYNAMFAAQDGCCAICGQKQTTEWAKCLAVDHDHHTKAIRSLLCAACNTAIGLMADSPERLRAAAGYLERHQRRLSPLTFVA